MTTNELLFKLPPFIGRNKVLDDNGKILGYNLDDKKGSPFGYLYLHNNGRYWFAYYGDKKDILCLDPESEKPNNNAFTYGKTPNEALQKLYDWCVENSFIK